MAAPLPGCPLPGQCIPSRGSCSIVPGLRYRPGQDEYVQIQRPPGGCRPKKEHVGEDKKGKPDEPVSDEPVPV